MTSPFPGMDPYLEDREHWRGFHHHLAEELVRQLNPQIVPKYFAEVEIHTVLQELTISETQHIYPDVNIVGLDSQATTQRQAVTVPEAPLERVVEIPEPQKQRAVNIYVTENRDLVTAIELLSPANKTGEGLIQYQQKRQRILRSPIHLVEFDLLRVGQRPGSEVAEPSIDTDYIVLLNRGTAGNIRISQIWPVGINDALPTTPIPLREPDSDVVLDLTAVVKKIYADNYYHYRIDYNQPVPPPKLRPKMATWIKQNVA
ncbi:DUF4058 family protein [Chloroflexi bacterium TSY]|nr:DUF4058 family protein [Chloroflexi bacterium TSY]